MAGLQSLPVLLELLGALAYEVYTGFLVVRANIDGTWVYDAGMGHDSRHITTRTFGV
jgi:hypothetical protein